MTKTQANEPGFVLVPALTAAQLADALGYFNNDALTAMHNGAADVGCIASGILAVANRLEEIAKESAPLVPSPAYGGVREALEPILEFTSFRAFESLPDSFVVTKGSPIAGPQLTAGDLRRARAAYEALSPVAVEEADAKAGEPLAFGYTNWRGEFAERNAIPLRIERKESEWHGPGLHWVMVAFDLEKQAERDFLIKDIGALSTPSPQIGKAGAGPVGGLLDVAKRILDRGYVSACIEEERPDHLALVAAIAQAEAGPVGEAVAWQYLTPGMSGWLTVETEAFARTLAGDHGQTRPLYPHPVEEPGEVERLTRERSDALHDIGVQNEQLRDMQIARETAEAALAETREALSRLLNAQAPFKVRGGESRLDASDRHQKERAEAAEAARAALTGDAQEGGR